MNNTTQLTHLTHTLPLSATLPLPTPPIQHYLLSRLRAQTTRSVTFPHPITKYYSCIYSCSRPRLYDSRLSCPLLCAEKDGFQNQRLTFSLLSATVTASPSRSSSCSYPSSSLHLTNPRAHRPSSQPRPLPPTQKRLRGIMARTEQAYIPTALQSWNLCRVCAERCINYGYGE